MKRILVAVDETEGSRRAAEFVDRFFSDTDTHIVAVNVARTPTEPVPPVPYGGVFAWQAAHPSEYTDALEQSEARAERVVAREAPTDAELRVGVGNPVDAISRAAEDENADLIVVGSNDRGFLQRLLSGSVSEELTRTAPRPVLVVR